MDWTLRRVFRISLFIFVLLINLSWSVAIIAMLWKSARIGGNFRLSDSVLVALVSTSIANFLGLVVIVARHLFPPGSSN
jgi:predicted neutral ceramidase superfamily lipid hydrolase